MEDSLATPLDQLRMANPVVKSEMPTVEPPNYQQLMNQAGVSGGGQQNNMLMGPGGMPSLPQFPQTLTNTADDPDDDDDDELDEDDEPIVETPPAGHMPQYYHTTAPPQRHRQPKVQRASRGQKKGDGLQGIAYAHKVEIMAAVLVLIAVLFAVPRLSRIPRFAKTNGTGLNLVGLVVLAAGTGVAAKLMVYATRNMN